MLVILLDNALSGFKNLPELNALEYAIDPTAIAAIPGIPPKLE